jgi:hypothetical protein
VTTPQQRLIETRGHRVQAFYFDESAFRDDIYAAMERALVEKALAMRSREGEVPSR